MKKEEFEKLKLVDLKKETVITAKDLINQKDRTLLYGYGRETFHVYIKNFKIHTVVYQNDYTSDIVKPKI